MEHVELLREPGTDADTTILRLRGPLTTATLFDYHKALRDPQLKNVVLDLSGTLYMDSAGLGTVLSQWAHAQRNGTKFAIAAVSPRVMTILEITHTDQVIPRFNSVEEAEQSFARAP